MIAGCVRCAHAQAEHAAGDRSCTQCGCLQYKAIGDAFSEVLPRRSPAFKDPIDVELGPSAPTVVDANGGKQSDLHYRFDLIGAKAMFRLAGILDHGERKYGEGNWVKIPTRSHLNHALVHIFAWLMGNRADDHLGHAFCRLMMAIETDHIMPVVDGETIGGKEESGSESL